MTRPSTKAEELGLEADEVAAALEQADAILEANDAGVLGDRGLGRGPGMHHFGDGPGRMSARMEGWPAAG